MGGYYNCIVEGSLRGSIVGGECNLMGICTSAPVCNSAIISGYRNCIENYVCNSTIIGGSCNEICGDFEVHVTGDRGKNDAIIGGQCNKISFNSNCSSIIGGHCNLIYDNVQDNFIDPEIFTQKLQTLSEQLPSILDDFKKSTCQFSSYALCKLLSEY
jgi:hypothetical protein